MLISLLAAALLQGQADPSRLVRDIQAAIDRDGGAPLERVWQNTLRARPRDRRALLAVATFERNRYRYERADSLLYLLMGIGGADSLEWRAAALLGRAAWRALGSDVATADSLLERAREDAERAGNTRLGADATLALAQIRGRTQGPEVSRRLLQGWWQALPRADAVDSAVYLCSLGTLDMSRGDTASIALVRRGLKIAQFHQSTRVEGNCMLALAQIADQRGYGDGARFDARSALSRFRRINYLPGIALAAQWYGYGLVEGTRLAEGRALLEEAIHAARVTRFESVEAWARLGLARFFIRVGDVQQARTYAAEAAQSHERRRDLWGIAASRLFEAEAMSLVGEFSEASQRYLDSFRANRAAGNPLSGTGALVARAGLQVRLGQVDSARSTVAALDSMSRSSAAWVRNERPILLGSIALAEGRLRAADSLLRSSSMAGTWRRGSTVPGAQRTALLEALVALRRGDGALVDSALAFLTTTYTRFVGSQIDRGYASALTQLRTTVGAPTEVYPALVAELARRGRAEDAFTLLEHVRARSVVVRRLRAVAHLMDSTRAMATLRSGARLPAVVTAAELRGELAADEAFVTYSLGRDSSVSIALVVTRGGMRSIMIGGAHTIATDVERFTRLAATGVEATALATRLGAQLLQSVIDSLSPSIVRLAMSPDGPLHRLPFDALRLSDGRRVVERVALSIAPSATALIALRAQPLPSGEQVVVVGDPTYRSATSAASTREGTDGPFAALSLPRLAYSAREATRVAEYGRQAVRLTGARASESALHTIDLSSTAVLHFAVHAVVHPESQEHTAIALAAGQGYDGFVQPDELGRLRLLGTFVVLSACRSAGGTVLGGEGLRGLNAPLLEAGARAVTGTLWSIGDQSVIPLVDRFYAGMARGLRPDDALRQAKLDAIQAGVSIADWAAFTITGDAGRAPRLRAPGTAPLPWARGARQATRDTSSTGAPAATP